MVFILSDDLYAIHILLAAFGISDTREEERGEQKERENREF